MRHVYFSSLPVGSVFMRHNVPCKKVDEEHFRTDDDGKTWIAEPHYGCMIFDCQFTMFDLTEDDVRDEPSPDYDAKTIKRVY